MDFKEYVNENLNEVSFKTQRNIESALSSETKKKFKEVLSSIKSELSKNDSISLKDLEDWLKSRATT